MTEDKKFLLLKDLYEQALKREEDRKQSYERKASTIVGFLGATVGIFVGVLLPLLLSEKILPHVFSDKVTIGVRIFWTASLIFFSLGIITFILLIFRWRRMLLPTYYMYPDPSSFEVESPEKEYLHDIKKSIDFNQININSLGTQFKNIVASIRLIVIFFLTSIIFIILCKLTLHWLMW